MNILQIKSSVLGENSVSSKYTSRLVRQLATESDSITVRDVAQQPVTAISGSVLGALANTDSDVAKEHNTLITELQNADTVVIAAPMYNFNIPSTLKNYMDAITRAGVTFKYTEAGPMGLLPNKKVYVVLTRGGKYKDNNMTFQEDYLRVHLGFLGMTDVTFIFLEGNAMGVTEQELDAAFQAQLI